MGGLGLDECVSLEALARLHEQAALDPVRMLGLRIAFLDEARRAAVAQRRGAGRRGRGAVRASARVGRRRAVRLHRRHAGELRGFRATGSWCPWSQATDSSACTNTTEKAAAIGRAACSKRGFHVAEICRVDEAFDQRRASRGLPARSGCSTACMPGTATCIERACETARESGGKAVVLTFDIDPDEVFHAERLKKLMTNEVAPRHADAHVAPTLVVVLPFTRVVRGLGARWRSSNETFDGTRARVSARGLRLPFRRARRRARWTSSRRGAPSEGMRVVAHDLSLGRWARPSRPRASGCFWPTATWRRRGRLLGRPYAHVAAWCSPGRGEGGGLRLPDGQPARARPAARHSATACMPACGHGGGRRATGPL